MYRLLLAVCLLLSGELLAQNEDHSTVDSVLRVAVVDLPPYTIQDPDDGNWSGMAVQLWRHAAEARQWRYELVAFDLQDSLIDKLTSGEVDVVLPAILNPEDERKIDFLQTYHRTSLGLALPKAASLWSIVQGLFSLQFLYIVLALSVLLLLIGTLIYFLERKNNGEQFGGDRSTWQGIGSGFWWAGVTMTTIGYGDKAPLTLPGRIVAMLWMLVALAVTSSLTAAVISAADAHQVVDFPNHLDRMGVGVVTDSPAAAYLDSRDIAHKNFGHYREGLSAMENKELDAFVGGTSTLRFALNRHGSLDAYIQETDAEPEAYAFAVRQGSPLREPLDEAVIQIILSTTWQDIIASYEDISSKRGQ